MYCYFLLLVTAWCRTAVSCVSWIPSLTFLKRFPFTGSIDVSETSIEPVNAPVVAAARPVVAASSPARLRSPGNAGRLSVEEVAALLQGHKRYGNKWSRILKEFPVLSKRTDVNP
jgi:hypothetical protein